MEKKTIKEFNSRMASAKLELIEIKDCVIGYELTTWTKIKDECLASNLNITIFNNGFDAKEEFKKFTLKWI